MKSDRCVTFKHRSGICKPFSERLKNCLELARLLSRRPQNISGLTRLFEVSERSVYRYFQSLRAAGFEFRKCENAGWYQIEKWR